MKQMVVDVRKLSNGVGSTRSVYQHGHFCVRTFHLITSYPVYSIFLFFILYLQLMDVILYFKICSRGLINISSLIPIKNHTDTDQTIHIFDPLPIKKIMVEPIVNIYIN
jgi:hypothetical protein